MKKDHSRMCRSFLKAFTWETFSYFLTIAVTFWYLQSFSASVKLTTLLFIVKILFFFLHERLWHQTKWGKTSPEE